MRCLTETSKLVQMRLIEVLNVQNSACGESEEDNMQNQASQQSSSDGVAVPIEKNMPKSMPSEIPEDDSGTGSKKEAITNEEAMASKVDKTSAIDGAQQVQGKNSEEDTQKSAISHKADAANILDDKSIEPQKAVVPAEESIKRQEGPSMNEEVLRNDAEYNSNKDGSTAPPKLEIAAMQVEDKHFDESIKISLAELKQPCPESESIINDNQTETNVSIPNHMSVNENMFPTLMNACESTQEITDMSSPDSKSEVGARKDPNLEYSEDKQAVEEIALQSGTQEPLVMSSPSEDIQKMTSPQASGAAGAKDIPNNPVMALKILSQKHGIEETSTEDKIFSATELCSSDAEPTKIPNGLQSFSEAKQDASLMHMQHKTMSTGENGLKESVKEPSGAFNILNDVKEENIGTENVKKKNSEVSNGFLHDERIKAKEETITSQLEKPESPTTVPLEKSEPEKQEMDITAVEVVEKKVKSESALEILEENNSFILHQGIEFKNNIVPEVEIGMLKNPNCLQSKLESIQENQGRTETILAVIDAIQEPLTLLSPPEHMETSDMTLLQELKVEEPNQEVSTIVDKLEKPAFKQFTDEFLHNDHDKAEEMDAANGTVEGPPHMDSTGNINMVPLVETEDKPSSTSVTVSANEVNQLTEIVIPESSASMYTIEVEGHDFNIQNKLANIATNLEKKEQALQSQNDRHTEEELNGMTEKDKRDVLEPEVNMLNDYKESLSNSEFTSNQTEEKSDEILQNSSSLIKVDSPQEQEDVSKASQNEMQNQDVNRVDTKNRSAENGMLSILDKEIPTWPATNITSTASTMEEVEPPPDMGKEDLIRLGDKSKHTTTSNSELHPSDYVSCPTLESWHEESEDDPKTPLLGTAPGSPEEKKESRSQDNLNMDDPRVSLERTDSEKIRTPLRHLFKDGSTVAVPEQIVVPKEQGISKEKSVKEIWGSPAKLVSTPPSKEKQKTKSIFSQCICCSAVH